MKKIKQWLMPLVIVMLIAAFIIYQVTEHQKLQALRTASVQSFETPLKTTYMQLNDLRTAVETKDARTLILFDTLLEDIRQLDTFVDTAKSTIPAKDLNDVRHLYSGFNTAHRYILFILDEGLTVDDTIISDGFKRDKVIDEKELTFLETLSDAYGQLLGTASAYLINEADYDQFLAALSTFNGQYKNLTAFEAIHSPADDALGVYDELHQLNDKTAAVRVGAYWGAIDKVGNWILEPLYDSITAGIDGDFIIESRTWWGILSSSGDEKLMLQCDSISVGTDYYTINDGAYMGLYDPLYDVDYDPQYELIYSISPDILLYKVSDYVCFIHRDGYLSTTPYQSIIQSGQYLIVQNADGFFEILDFDAHNVTGNTYDDVINLYGDHAIVLTSVGYMAISLVDQTSVPIDADRIFGSNTAENILFTKNMKTGILNARGEIVIPASYDYLVPFDGNVTTPAIKDAYDMVTYIDHDGNIVLETDFPYGNAFDSEGHAIVSDGMDYGLINQMGEIILPCEYDDVSLIRYDGDIYGYAVEQDGAIAVADLTGSLQTTFQYDAVDAFPELNGIIGYTGDVTVILSRNSFEPLITGNTDDIDTLVYSEQHYAYHEGSEWGIKALNGQSVTLPIYDDILWLNETGYAVTINNKCYLYTF
ncbi:WG repeat-containing protein [Fusibacter paucivorans]|uniref:WG repeat-containing protein n=1 Tax=Fusibacter paucivorans TaxID=76009 RepID=A0ABS5PSW5_9FIRM|nr:WG repeat-containing protein [Fusibacter paucivorans]MBS7528263.1 WG repeat-containing protein [Fusibacter paucivorans]